MFQLLPLDVQRLVAQYLSIEEQNILCTALGDKESGLCNPNDWSWIEKIEREYKLTNQEQHDIQVVENILSRRELLQFITDKEFKRRISILEIMELHEKITFFKKWKIWNKYMFYEGFGSWGSKDIRVDIIKSPRFLERYINCQDLNGLTALMGAALNGDIELVKLLLLNGADVEMVNIHGKNALRIAKDMGYHGISDLLIAASCGVVRQSLGVFVG